MCTRICIFKMSDILSTTNKDKQQQFCLFKLTTYNNHNIFANTILLFARNLKCFCLCCPMCSMPFCRLIALAFGVSVAPWPPIQRHMPELISSPRLTDKLKTRPTRCKRDIAEIMFAEESKEKKNNRLRKTITMQEM